MLTVERDGVIVTRPAPIRLRCRCCMGSIPSTRALCSGTATAEVQVRGTDAVRCALRTCCKCVSCMTCHRTWARPKVRHIPLPVSPCSSGAQSGRRSTPSFSPKRRSSNCSSILSNLGKRDGRCVSGSRQVTGSVRSEARRAGVTVELGVCAEMPAGRALALSEPSWAPVDPILLFSGHFGLFASF